jgi:hypothetical protein
MRAANHPVGGGHRTRAPLSRRLPAFVSLLLAWSNGALGQNHSLTKECLVTATTDDDRASCMRLEECASQCGAGDSCMLTCATSGHASATASLTPSPLSPRLSSSVRQKQPQQQTNCAVLLAYRDRELERDFTTAVRMLDLDRQQAENYIATARNTLNLMSEQWLIGQTGAEIAIQLKLLTDEVGAFLHMLAPGEHAAVDLVERSGVTLGILRSAIESGAKKASEDGAKEAIWTLSEELSPLVTIQHGFLSYAENEAGMEDYKAEVQRQVAALVNSARKWQDREAEARSEAASIAEIRQHITAVCRGSTALAITPR